VLQRRHLSDQFCHQFFLHGGSYSLVLPDYIPMTIAAAPKVIEVNREEWLSQLLLAM
jgi:hypothetical protein